MAKPSTVMIKLVSSAGTGTFYTTRKNSRKTTEKMVLRKYDPKIRRCCEGGDSPLYHICNSCFQGRTD